MKAIDNFEQKQKNGRAEIVLDADSDGVFVLVRRFNEDGVEEMQNVLNTNADQIAGEIANTEAMNVTLREQLAANDTTIADLKALHTAVTSKLAERDAAKKAAAEKEAAKEARKTK